MSQVFDFLRGRGPNNHGEMLRQVLIKSTVELQEDTGWERWLFPLYEPSRGSQGVPLIDVTEILAGQKDAVVRYNMRKSYERMTTYFDNPFWIINEDHNHGRITRIIESLRLFQHEWEAQQFHEFIMKRITRMRVSRVSILRWNQAMGLR